MMDKRGFTITETLVASVVFMTAVIGVMATMNVGTSDMVVSQEEIDAAYYGKQVMEDLRAKVDARNWAKGGGGPMDPDAGVIAYGTMGPYTATYDVEEDDAQWGTARKVTVTITW